MCSSELNDGLTAMNGAPPAPFRPFPRRTHELRAAL
jgi:hypothetical protein